MKKFEDYTFADRVNALSKMETETDIGTQQRKSLHERIMVEAFGMMEKCITENKFYDDESNRILYGYLKGLEDIAYEELNKEFTIRMPKEKVESDNVVKAINLIHNLEEKNKLSEEEKLRIFDMYLGDKDEQKTVEKI